MGQAGHRDTLISHIGDPLVIALAFSIAGRSALSSIKLRERGVGHRRGHRSLTGRNHKA